MQEKNNLGMQLLEPVKPEGSGVNSQPCSAVPLTSVKPGFTGGAFGAGAGPCTQTAKGSLFKKIQCREAQLWGKSTALCMSW